VRVSVKYYLIAMFFVVFDLEAVFLFAWAGAVRELGWAGYCEVLLFVGVFSRPSFISGRSGRWIGREVRGRSR
jgi:NADH:ubiquinone oxidoreductase subunit 3 (subunit A)